MWAPRCLRTTASRAVSFCSMIIIVIILNWPFQRPMTSWQADCIFGLMLSLEWQSPFALDCSIDEAPKVIQSVLTHWLRSVCRKQRHDPSTGHGLAVGKAAWLAGRMVIVRLHWPLQRQTTNWQADAQLRHTACRNGRLHATDSSIDKTPKAC